MARVNFRLRATDDTKSATDRAKQNFRSVSSSLLGIGKSSKTAQQGVSAFEKGVEKDLGTLSNRAERFGTTWAIVGGRITKAIVPVQTAVSSLESSSKKLRNEWRSVASSSKATVDSTNALTGSLGNVRTSLDRATMSADKFGKAFKRDISRQAKYLKQTDHETKELAKSLAKLNVGNQHVQSSARKVADSAKVSNRQLKNMERNAQIVAKLTAEGNSSVASSYSKVAARVKNVGNTIKETFRSAATAGANAFKKIAASAQQSLRSLVATGRTAFNSLVTAAAGVGNSIVRGLRAAGSAGSDFFSKIVNSAKQRLQPLATIGKNAFTSLVDGARAVGAAINKRLQPITSRASRVFTSVSNFAKEQFRTVSDAVGSAFTSVSNRIKSFGNSAKQGFQSVSNIVTGVFNRVSTRAKAASDSVRKSFQAVSSTITGAFTKANQVVRTFAESAKQRLQPIARVGRGALEAVSRRTSQAARPVAAFGVSAFDAASKQARRAGVAINTALQPIADTAKRVFGIASAEAQVAFNKIRARARVVRDAAHNTFLPYTNAANTAFKTATVGLKTFGASAASAGRTVSGAFKEATRRVISLKQLPSEIARDFKRGGQGAVSAVKDLRVSINNTRTSITRTVRSVRDFANSFKRLRGLQSPSGLFGTTTTKDLGITRALVSLNRENRHVLNSAQKAAEAVKLSARQLARMERNAAAASNTTSGLARAYNFLSQRAKLVAMTINRSFQTIGGLAQKAITNVSTSLKELPGRAQSAFNSVRRSVKSSLTTLGQDFKILGRDAQKDITNVGTRIVDRFKTTGASIASNSQTAARLSSSAFNTASRKIKAGLMTLGDQGGKAIATIASRFNSAERAARKAEREIDRLVKRAIKAGLVLERMSKSGRVQYVDASTGRFISRENIANMMRLQEAANRVTTAVRKQGKAVKDTRSLWRKLSDDGFQGFRRIGVTIGSTLAVVYTFARAVRVVINTFKEYAELQHSIAEIQTLIVNTNSSASELTVTIENLSVATGKAASDIATSLYDALSATVPLRDAIKLTTEAAIGATAGLSTVENATGGLTAAYNAFGLSSQKANDQFFTTVRLGTLKFPDVTKAVGQFAGTAQAANIPLSDMLGALATLTTRGIKVDEAIVQINNAIKQLLKGTSATGMAFREVTGKSFTDFIRGGGSVIEAMVLMGQHAQRTNKNLFELVPEIRAAKGFQGLIAASDQWKQNADEIATATGAADEAFNKLSATHQTGLNRLSQGWDNFKRDIGEGVAALADFLQIIPSQKSALEVRMEGIYYQIQAINSEFDEAIRKESDFSTRHAEGIPLVTDVLGRDLSVLLGFFDNAKLTKIDNLRSQFEQIAEITPRIVGDLKTWDELTDSVNNSYLETQKIVSDLQRQHLEYLDSVTTTTEHEQYLFMQNIALARERAAKQAEYQAEYRRELENQRSVLDEITARVYANEGSLAASRARYNKMQEEAQMKLNILALEYQATLSDTTALELIRAGNYEGLSKFAHEELGIQRAIVSEADIINNSLGFTETYHVNILAAMTAQGNEAARTALNLKASAINASRLQETLNNPRYREETGNPRTGGYFDQNGNWVTVPTTRPNWFGEWTDVYTDPRTFPEPPRTRTGGGGSQSDPTVQRIRDALDIARHEYNIAFRDIRNLSTEQLTKLGEMWKESIVEAAKGASERGKEAYKDAIREISQFLETGAGRIADFTEDLSRQIYNALNEANERHQETLDKAGERLRSAIKRYYNEERQYLRAREQLARAVEESDLKHRKAVNEAQIRLNNLLKEEVSTRTRIDRSLEDASFGYRRAVLVYAKDASELNKLSLEEAQIKLLRARSDQEDFNQATSVEAYRDRILIAREELEKVRERTLRFYYESQQYAAESAHIQLQEARNAVIETSREYINLSKSMVEVYFDAFGQIQTRLVESTKEGFTQAEMYLQAWAERNKVTLDNLFHRIPTPETIVVPNTSLGAGPFQPILPSVNYNPADLIQSAYNFYRAGYTERDVRVYFEGDVVGATPEDIARVITHFLDFNRDPLYGPLYL